MTTVPLLLSLFLHPVFPAVPDLPKPSPAKTVSIQPAPALEDVQAFRNRQSVTLKWRVSENEEASRFDVEKSADGITFRPAALVFGTDKENTEEYSFTDKPGKGRVYYRIILVAKDRTTLVGPVVSPAGTDRENHSNE